MGSLPVLFSVMLQRFLNLLVESLHSDVGLLNPLEETSHGIFVGAYLSFSCASPSLLKTKTWAGFLTWRMSCCCLSLLMELQGSD